MLAIGFNKARSMLATELKGGVGSMGKKVPFTEAFHVLPARQYLSYIRTAGIKLD